MEKSFKKELEKEINESLVQLLSGHDKKAVMEVKDVIKSSGKILAKKFNKEVKKIKKAKLKIAQTKPSVKKITVAKKKGVRK